MTRSFFLILAAALVVGAAASALAAGPLPPESCPLTGFEQTSFERVIARNCGRVPFPVDEIGKYLKVEDDIESRGDIGSVSGKSPDFFRVPFGRSLVRHETDMASPRYLTEFSHSKRDEFLPILYLGYSPRPQQLEVLSWNDLKSRYDFFVVDHYSSNSSGQIRSERASCTVCHQNGGPIFARAPWTESESTFGTLFPKPAEAGAPRASGEPAPFAYDSRVRQSSYALRLAQLCDSICTTSSCRADLLSALLQQHATRRPGQGLEITHSPVGRFFEKYPAAGMVHSQGLPSSVIPDRIPGPGGQGGRIQVLLKAGSQEVDPAMYQDSSFATLEGTLEAIDAARTFQVPDTFYAADPKFPRPLQPIDSSTFARDPETGLRVCFKIWPGDLENLHLEEKLISQNIQTQPAKDIYFAIGSPSRDQTLEFISGSKISPSIQQSLSLSIPNANERSPPALLREACSGCHGKGFANSRGSGGYELPLDSLPDLQNYGQGDLILRLIRDGIMPPKDAHRALSSEEKTLLIEYLSRK